MGEQVKVIFQDYAAPQGSRIVGDVGFVFRRPQDFTHPEGGQNFAEIAGKIVKLDLTR